MLGKFTKNKEFQKIIRGSSLCGSILSSHFSNAPDTDSVIQVLNFILKSDELSAPIYEGKVTIAVGKLISKIVESIQNHASFSEILLHLLVKGVARPSELVGLIEEVASKASPGLISQLRTIPEIESLTSFHHGLYANPHISQDELVSLLLKLEKESRLPTHLHSTNKVIKRISIITKENLLKELIEKTQDFQLLIAALFNQHITADLADKAYLKIYKLVENGAYARYAGFIVKLSTVIPYQKLFDLVRAYQTANYHALEEITKCLVNEYNDALVRVVWSLSEKKPGHSFTAILDDDGLQKETAETIKKDIIAGALDRYESIWVCRTLRDRGWFDKADAYKYAKSRLGDTWTEEFIRFLAEFPLAEFPLTKKEAAELYTRALLSKKPKTSQNAYLFFTREIKKSLRHTLTEAEFRKIGKNIRAMQQLG